MYEVDTGMHAVVDDVHTVHLVLCVQVGVEALLDVLHDWPPRVVIVHEVTETRGVNHGKTKAYAVLLDVGADGLYADGLGCEVERRLFAFFRRV